MANYTIEDIQNALQQNLISEEDAQYLAQELEGAPVGGMMGGALGAAGVGAIGAALGGGAGRKLASRYADVADGAGRMGGLAKKTASAMNAPIQAPGIGPGTGSFNAAQGLGAAAGAGAGGLAGASAGNMALPPGEGEGVQGEMTPEGPDRDMMLQMLMDPQVPAKQKQQIMQMLQSMDASAPDSLGSGGMLDAGVLGMGAGMLAGGGGALMGSRIASRFGQKAMPEGAGAIRRAMGKAADFAPTNAGIGTAIGGGGVAGMGMGMGANAMMREPQDELAAYAEPF